ncbi:hypothetical protein Tco_0677514 [Tanacetum coccineum]|uniref:Uncharacterized protein n=1 Tax=Tanacetum coccineum TaxID=301880 RepID=A0ABQ4XDK0_9ASTR
MQFKRNSAQVKYLPVFYLDIIVGIIVPLVLKPLGHQKVESSSYPMLLEHCFNPYKAFPQKVGTMLQPKMINGKLTKLRVLFELLQQECGSFSAFDSDVLFRLFEEWKSVVNAFLLENKHGVILIQELFWVNALAMKQFGVDEVVFLKRFWVEIGSDYR